MIKKREIEWSIHIDIRMKYHNRWKGYRGVGIVVNISELYEA